MKHFSHLPGMLALCLLFLPRVASAQPIDFDRTITIERPGDREFIVDNAQMLDEAAEKQIRELCDKLLTDKATPIIVVTINSMRLHNDIPMPIEIFAANLFNQWGIGINKLGREDWNTGILLLVSKEDRRARIELGAGWGHRKDATCQQIMDDYIVAEFKRGNFQNGIVSGVTALDAMARELELPTVPRPWWHYAVAVTFVALLIFTIVSLIRNGSSGWAWIFWAAVFGFIGYILYQMAQNSGSSSGGGFSGGSFGGGFSGGGGASGSW